MSVTVLIVYMGAIHYGGPWIICSAHDDESTVHAQGPKQKKKMAIRDPLLKWRSALRRVLIEGIPQLPIKGHHHIWYCRCAAFDFDLPPLLSFWKEETRPALKRKKNSKQLGRLLAYGQTLLTPPRPNRVHEQLLLRRFTSAAPTRHISFFSLLLKRKGC